MQPRRSLDEKASYVIEYMQGIHTMSDFRILGISIHTYLQNEKVLNKVTELTHDNIETVKSKIDERKKHNKEQQITNYKRFYFS
jgi:uncharacterized spore protein YtfJ